VSKSLEAKIKTLDTDVSNLQTARKEIRDLMDSYEEKASLASFQTDERLLKCGEAIQSIESTFQQSLKHQSGALFAKTASLEEMLRSVNESLVSKIERSYDNVLSVVQRQLHEVKEECNSMAAESKEATQKNVEMLSKVCFIQCCQIS